MKLLDHVKLFMAACHLDRRERSYEVMGWFGHKIPPPSGQGFLAPLEMTNDD